jgi:hypothetical protein
MPRRILFFSLFLPLMLGLTPPASAKEPRVLGWVEEVKIEGVAATFKAKLDTGAKTSSIDAEVIDIRKEGKKIEGKRTGEVVVFSVRDDKTGRSSTFERPILRYVRIKKKGGGYLRRPVIAMKFCLAGQWIKEEVNLANRENFIYPVLVGRNMMEHAGLAVDPARTLTSRPRCEAKG